MQGRWLPITSTTVECSVVWSRRDRFCMLIHVASCCDRACHSPSPLFLLGSMKRRQLEVDPNNLGRAWAGLMTFKASMYDPPDSEAAASSGLRRAHACDFCGAVIHEKPESCFDCDAGPFHNLCVQHHACPVTGNSPVKSGPGGTGTGSPNNAGMTRFGIGSGQEPTEIK